VVSHVDLFTAFKTYYKFGQFNNRLQSYQVNREGEQETISLEFDGEIWSGNGSGTLSALCDAYQQKTGKSIDVIDYAEHAIQIENMSNGKDAFAVAYVLLQTDEGKKVGVATAQDTVSAMIQATLKGIMTS